MTERASERGAVAVMVALLALLLVICIAFAVDLGYAWQVRRSMVKATDAAALSAAREARDWAALPGNSLNAGDCAVSTSDVTTAADSALTANRSDAAMTFCAIGQDPTRKTGVVTVGGSTEAQTSFAGVIGWNEIPVRSSTSVLWKQPRILPIAVCADAVGNNDLARWIADPTSPLVKEMKVSSSANSRLCSSGGSGYWGAMDLGRNVDGPTSFSQCRDTAAAESTWKALFGGQTISPSPRVGEYYCASVGIPDGFTTEVDRLICSLEPDEDLALPIIAERPNFTNRGNLGKTWVARVGGYVTARFKGYEGVQDRQDLCASATGRAAGRTGERRVRSHRSRIRRFELARAVQRRAVAIPGKANVSNLTPTSATVVSGGTVTFTATISNLTPTTTITSPTIRVQLPAGATMVSGCVPSQTGGQSYFDCTASESLAPAGTTTVTFTASFTASGAVSANLKCTDTGNCKLIDGTQVSSTITVTTGGGGGGSGSKTITVTVNGTGTVTSSEPPGTTCTTTCRTNYQGNQTITLTAVESDPGSRFVSWGGCSAPNGLQCVVNTNRNREVTATFNRVGYTLRTSIGAGSGSGFIRSQDGRIDCSSVCTTDYTQPTRVVLEAFPNSVSAFDYWSGDCDEVSDTTCTVILDDPLGPIPLVTAFFVDDSGPAQDFRTLTLEFTAAYHTPGLVLTDVAAYRICAIDVKQADALLACKP
ncbi:MAG: pilus assembly protein TadG-related protein [Actinomycetes bacterium]